MKATLIWDLENISIKYIDIILNRLSIYEKCNKLAISKANIKDSSKKKLNDNNIRFIQCNQIADKFILDTLKITSETTSEYIIITSDSDFCEISKELSFKGKKITWFLSEKQKKRIIMKNDITDSNIKYIVLENKFKKIKVKNKRIKSNLTKPAVGKKSKFSLEYLEELKDNFNPEVVDPEYQNRINFYSKYNYEKVLEKREIHIKELIQKTVKNFFDKYKDGVCDFCGAVTQVKSAGMDFCQCCEEKFVLDCYNYKELTHEERLNLFFDKTGKELKESGIIYYDNLTTDLLQKELDRNIQVAPRYLISNINNYYKEN